MDKWILDKKINLNDLCESNGWHLASSIQALVDQGIERRDADCFINFTFNEDAIEKGGKVDTVSSDDYLDDDQWERLDTE